MRPVVEVHDGGTRDGQSLGQALWFICPGCGSFHSVRVNAPPGVTSWTWNGSVDSPTLSPSIRTSLAKKDGRGDRTLCHFFVKEGRIEFCSDSPHELAGRTVAMEAIPVGGLFSEGT